MAKSIDSQISFSGGEFSPRLDARVDQEKYRSAGRQLLNMIPYKQGPLTRRPGTQYIAAAKLKNGYSTSYGVRLVKFIYSPTTTFILELGNNYIRFYSNGQQIQVSGNPVEVSTPYSAEYITANVNKFATDIWQVNYCQINDVMYFTSPKYPVYKLTRISDTNWTFAQVQFITPALLDQNATEISISATSNFGKVGLAATAPAWVANNFYAIGNSVQIGSVLYNCITAHISGSSFVSTYWKSQTIFQPTHLNSYWQLATLRSSASIEIDAPNPSSAFPSGASGYSNQIQIYGNWECHTYGVWNASFDIERSIDGGSTWTAIRTISGQSDRNVDITGTASQSALFRIHVNTSTSPSTAGATAPRIVLEAVDGFLYGLVQICTPDAWNSSVSYIPNMQVTYSGVTYYCILAVNSATNPATDTTHWAVNDSNHACANVIQQLYNNAPLATAWVSGTGVYHAGDIVSYEEENYTCILAISGGSTPPPQNTGNWSPTGPNTLYWSEGAWSDYRGYPQAITSYQQRVIYASSAYEPQRIWGTVTNDIENFALGDQTLATDSFAFDLNAVGRGPIVWMCAQNNLIAGFSGAEWVISGSAATTGGSIGGSISPTSIQAVEHSTYGSIFGVTPLVVGDGIIFTQRQANQIRQMMFSVYTEKYMSQSLTTYSGHLFNSGIVQLDYQQQWHGQPEIWAVTQQGQLCGMTYEMDQNIFGWHNHTTGANTSTPDSNYPDVGFESVSTLFGNGKNDDEVWVVANRYVSPPIWYYGNTYAVNDMVWSANNTYICIAAVTSSTLPGADPTHWQLAPWQTIPVRSIERFNPNNWEQTFTAAPNPPQAIVKNAYYVDSGFTVTGITSGPSLVGVTLSNLNNLAGRWVVGLADGNAFGPVQVGYTDTDYGTVVIPSGYPPAAPLWQSGFPYSKGIQVSWGTGSGLGNYEALNDIPPGTTTPPSSDPTNWKLVNYVGPNIVQVGLPITYSAQAMRYDSDQRVGNTQSLIKQISDVFIRVYNSCGGLIANKYPAPNTWVSGTTYGKGSQVSYFGYNYQAVATVYTDIVPPSNDPTNWRLIGGAPYQPVPIPYIPTGNPLNGDPTQQAQGLLVTTPTDIRVTPQLNLTPDTDPIIIVTGSDALPLTVLALIIKYDVIATP